METINIKSLAYVINVHSRMVADAHHTPYRYWCEYVHASSASLEEKWANILNWKINPIEYDNPSVFASDWQLYKLLSKFSLGGLPTEKDKEAGYQKFLDAEHMCELHNTWMTTGSNRPAFNAIRHYSGKIVTRVLGDIADFFAYVEKLPPVVVKRYDPTSKFSWKNRFSFEHDPVDCPSFGPGVSVGVRGDKLSSPTEKLLLGTVTKQCAYLGNWLSGLFRIPNAKLAQGSVLTFVVKRVGEARTICYEPSMNMLVQKLIGRYLKHRLKVVLGIDLRDQQCNVNFARLGSLCDSYATEDMSAASDLWSYQFVMDQLPFEWFKLLDDARSHEYYDPLTKNWAEFNKFSTMGNGFTFELETLLFYAVTHAAIEHCHGIKLGRDELSVYGDDIIFPKDYARTVEQALMLCGHRPNTEKSFHHGPFRESCGGDFFQGWDVTPVKIKEFDVENPRDIINIYNRLSALSRDGATLCRVHHRFDRALVFIKDRLVRDFPRVSSGPVEQEVNPDYGWVSYITSDRWLMDDLTINNVWSSDFQYVCPKWVCCEVSKIRTDYHLHPTLVPYLVEHGCEAPNLKETKVAFVRNPVLKRRKGTSDSPIPLRRKSLTATA